MKYFTLTTNEGSNIGTIAANDMDSFLKLSNVALESHYDEETRLSFNRPLTFNDLCDGNPRDINIHFFDYSDVGQVEMTYFYQ